MDAVLQLQKESLHTVGSHERGAVGISQLRGSFAKATKETVTPIGTTRGSFPTDYTIGFC